MQDQNNLLKKLFLGLTITIPALVSGLFTPVKAQVVISEIHPNPTEGQPEWFELVNLTNQTVKLTNLEAWDQLSQPSKLLTFELTLDPKQTKVVFLPTNKLNNSGDTLSLKDSKGGLIDQVQFGQTSKGKSYTLTRVNPASFGWQEPSPNQISPSLVDLISPTTTPKASQSATPTPKLTPTPESKLTQTPNPTVNPTNSSPTPTLYLLKAQDLKLTEIMACPEKNQSEWLEIYWLMTETVLTQLTLEDETQNKLEFNLTTKPNEYQVLELNKTILNNSGDKIKLLNAKEQLLKELTLPACQAGQSYALIGDSWRLTNSNTPQKPNPSFTPVHTPNPTLTKANNLLNQTNLENSTPKLASPKKPFQPTKQLPTLKITRLLPTFLSATSSGQVLGSETKISNPRLSFFGSLSVIIGGASFFASGSIYLKSSSKNESSSH